MARFLLRSAPLSLVTTAALYGGFNIGFGPNGGFSFFGYNPSGNFNYNYAGPSYGGGGALDVVIGEKWVFSSGFNYYMRSMNGDDTTMPHIDATTFDVPLTLSWVIENKRGFSLKSGRDRLVWLGLGPYISKDLEWDWSKNDSLVLEDKEPDLEIGVVFTAGLIKWVWEWFAVNPRLNVLFNLTPDDSQDSAGAGKRSAWNLYGSVNITFTGGY